MIEKDIEDIKSTVNIILEAIQSIPAFAMTNMQKSLSAVEVAELYGLTKSQIYTTYRWRLPGFGMKQGKGDMRWTLQEVLDWNKRSREEREEEYQKILFDQSLEQPQLKKRGRPRKQSKSVGVETI